MITKLYGYGDANGDVVPYHFKNCSKNGCVTKQYLGYTTKFMNENAYCGDCGGSSDEAGNVNNRGIRYRNNPNGCCFGLGPKGPFIDGFRFQPDPPGFIDEWYLPIQSAATTPCYELRDKYNDIVYLLATPDTVKESLEKIADKACQKPAFFDCRGSNITWMQGFPTFSIISNFRDKLLLGIDDDLNDKFKQNFLPNMEDSPDFTDLLYNYNYSIGCDYTIHLVKETYTYELEIDLVIPEFIGATATVPPTSSTVPGVCIKNPIYGPISWSDSKCIESNLPCSNKLTGYKIINKITSEPDGEEPVGCCTGSPREDYCCNRDFQREIETKEEYECFTMKTEQRKFYRPETELAQCAEDTTTSRTIPVCIAAPVYIVVKYYDVTTQGVCDRDTVFVPPSDSGCKGEMIDFDNHCIRLDLNYVPPIITSPADQAIILEYYYCEVTYIDCA